MVGFFWESARIWGIGIHRTPSLTAYYKPHKFEIGLNFIKIILQVWFWKMSGKSSTYRKNKTQKNFFCIYKRNPSKFFLKKNQPWNLASKIPSRTVKFGTIFEKIILPVWFWKMSGKSSTYRKNKTHKNFFCIYHYSYIYTYIPKVYTILLSRDLN